MSEELDPNGVYDWTQEHGSYLQANGKKMVKKPNPVYMIQQFEDGVVLTNEGPLRYSAGSYIAHDPISGHVWPVADKYVAQHYYDAP